MAMNWLSLRNYFFAASLVLALTAAGCAPPQPYRPAYPRNDVSSAPRVPPAPPVYSPTNQESDRRPLPQDQRIREQDLKAKTPPAKETRESARQARVGEAPAAPET